MSAGDAEWVAIAIDDPGDLYRIGHGFLNCPDVAADDERPAEPALPHLYM